MSQSSWYPSEHTAYEQQAKAQYETLAGTANFAPRGVPDVQPKRHQNSIESAIDDLKSQERQIEEMLAALSNRLEPVLRPQGPTGNGGPEPCHAPECGLGAVLQELLMRLATCNGTLAIIHDRLVL